MDIVFFATAWGPLHGGINAFNHDLALAVAKELPKPGRVFCSVLRPDPMQVQDAAGGGVILIPLDRDKALERMDPDWVNSVEKAFGKHGGVPQEACWVGHDVISGALAMEARRRFGGRCALIHHMSYGAYQPVKASRGSDANTKLTAQEDLFSEAMDCALFGVGPLLQRSCRDLSGREVAMLIPGFPEAAANISSDTSLQAITFGRLGSEDDRIKLGLLAARGFALALDRNAAAPVRQASLMNPAMFALGLDGDSEEEDYFKAMTAVASERAIPITTLPYGSRQDIFRRLTRSNLCMMLSWHEGFGLTAWEAVAHEVPLILSRNSGAYELIEQTLDPMEARGLLEPLDVRGSSTDENNLNDTDTQAVAAVIEQAAADLPARKAAAKRLKARLQEKLGCTWQGAAEAFLAALYTVPFRSTGAGNGSAPSASGTPSNPHPTPTVRRAGLCTGRDAEVGEYVPLLLSKPALLLNGPGGMGKTTLARRLAHDAQVVARFGDRRHEAELAPALTVDALQAAIARAIGADPALPFEATLRAMGGGPRLLLLDNLESPWDAPDQREAVAETLGRLGEVPGLVLLATLRGSDVPPEPGWAVRPVGKLAKADAQALFLEISRLKADEPCLDEFLDALDGLPLAIMLVARRAQDQHGGLRAFWEEWQAEGVKAARNPYAKGDERHGSLVACIEFSLKSKRLTPTGRRLFSWLGALPAGLCLEDRRALQGEAEAEDAAGQLVGVGLALVEKGRLDLLPPIRRHADAAYRPKDKAARQWVEHFLKLTAGFERIMLSEGGKVMARLIPELPNLEAALHRAVDVQGFRAAAYPAVWTYAEVCSRSGLGGAVLRRLADASGRDGDLQPGANCLLMLAKIALQRSDHAAARSGYEEALPIYRAVGDRLGEANCIKGLADIALRRSDHGAALSGYEEALPIYRAVSDRLGEANCIKGLADIALQHSDHAAARAGNEEALPIYRAVGDRLGEADAIKGLAETDLAGADTVAARGRFDQALATARDLSARLLEAEVLRGLGDLARAEGHPDEAHVRYSEALAIQEQMENAQEAAETRARLEALDAPSPPA